MAAVGFASIPISVSARGVMAELEKTLGGPMQKAAQKAAEEMEKSLVDGAKRTANEVEKARQAEVRAARDVEAAERKILEAKEKTRQQTVKVETAEKQLEIVRSAQGRKVADMEAAIEKARKDGKTSVEDLTRKEELLREARLKADVAVTSKEEALQKAYRDSEKAARDVESAEKARQAAVSKAKDAADNVVAAQKRMDGAQQGTNKQVGEGTSAFEKLREQLRLTGSDLDEAAGKSAGFGDKLMGGLKTMGTGALLGIGAKMGSTLVGGFNTAMSSGFSRLQSIEQAETMLQGLGHSTESTAAIMDNAMASVKGTAFGFGEAASMAATFAGAGIKEGEDLTRILTLVGDTAAITGRDFGEMGAIWTKVATGQKLQTAEMNQLMDRGLGVLPKLQEHYGVTAEEARKMVTEGKVDFEAFSQIMEGMVGGAAQAMGETFSGSAANMRASLGRLGAKFLEPVFSNAPAIFTAVGGAVDKVNEKVTPLVEEWSARLQPLFARFAEDLGPALEVAVDRVAGALGRSAGWARENEAWLKPLVAVIGGAAAGFVAWQAAIAGWTTVTKVATGIQLAFNSVLLANPIMLAVVAMGALTAGLVYFFTKTETGQRIWADFTEKVTAGWDWVTEKVTAGMEGIQVAWSVMSELLATGWEWIERNVFAPLAAGLDVLVTAFTWWVERVRENWQLFQDILSAGWRWINDNVFTPITVGLDWVAGWFGTQITRISGVWKVLQDVLAAGWRWINDNVFAAIGRGLDTLVGWFDVGVQAMGTLWDGLKKLFAEPINFVIRTVYTDGIKPVFDGVAEKVGLDSRLPDITPIGGYAHGGILPGYTPGRDPYEFIEPRTGMRIGLSGGEAILRPEATRALGEDWVNSINAAARSGGRSGVENHLRRAHFASGGIVDLGNFASGGFTNLAGALSAIQASHGAFVGRFFPDLFNLTSAMRFTDTGHHSTGKATDWQAKDGQFASQMPTPGSKALARAIFVNFPNSAELIHAPLDGWQNLSGGSPYNFGAATDAAHGNHVHWATNSPLRFDGDDIVLDDAPGAGRFSFDPASWFSALWERVTGPLPSFGGPGDLGRVPGEALSTMGGWVKDWALGTLREWAEKFMNFVGLGGGGAQQWADQAAEALRRMGYGQEHLGAMLRQIEIESSGDPTAINTWDSNYLRGTPSGGLLQVIEPTYRDVRNRYPEAFEGLPDDRFHPLTNLTAGVAAVTRDWGGPAGRWPTKDGYAHGGLAGPGQGLLLKTAMEPEYVLNPAMTQAFIDWMRAGSGGEVPIVRLEAPAWEGFAAQVDEATLAALDLGRSLEGPFLDSTAEVKKALEELDAARQKADQGTDKVSEAEKALADAQKELEDALNGTSETSTSTARKIEDAEAALAKAREESSGTSVSASRKIIDAEKALAKAREDGKADKIAAAEERLARAREDQSTSAAKSAEKSAEKIAEAEKRLARAREDEAEAAAKAEEKRAQSVEKAEEKISKAEKNLEKARRESVTAADEVVAAEKRVATARLQAAGRIITDIGGAVTGIVGHFARLSSVMADMARQAEATEEALAGQRVEAAMAELQRLKALANFAQAEKDLEHARVSGAEMTRLIGDTSVSAMGLALERFRKDGVFAVEMVSGAAEAGAQSVNAVQRDVDAERMAAAHQLQMAALDYAEASLAASHAAEIQKILGLQLLAQQQAIYGVSSMQYDAMTQFIQGIVKIISGVVKIGAGIAAAIAAISAGPAGWIALPGIIAAAIDGATDIGQGWTMVQDNKDEAREAWDGMDAEGRFNAVAAGLGAAAPAVVGGIGFGMTGDAQVLVETAKAMEAATKTMVDHTEFLVKRQMDQATVPYEEQIAEVTKRHEAEMAELRVLREGIVTAYESGSDEIAEAVERLLDSVLGESIKPEATDLVAEARSAAEQRDELVQATRQIADRPVEKQPVVVNVTGSGLTVQEVQEVFDYVNGRVDGLQLQVNQIGQQNAVATVAAQR